MKKFLAVFIASLWPALLFGAATVGIPAGLPPSGVAGGSLAGTYPNPTLNLSVPTVWTAQQSINIAAVGVTQPLGLLVENLTAATAGNQQFSPLFEQLGSGWGTTAPGAQSVAFGWQVQPVQGTTAPTGNYVLYSQINGGSLTNIFQITDAGIVSISNTADNTGSNTGSLQLQGGLYVAKSFLVGGNLQLSGRDFVANNSASTPAYCGNPATTTGMYFGAGPLLGLSVNGVAAETLTSTAAVFSTTLATPAPPGASAGAWKLGSLVTGAVVLDTTRSVYIDIGGTVYHLMVSQ